MAAGVLPYPDGSEHAPCSDACSHKDCNETKRLAQMECVYCGQRIGFDTRFYQEALPLPTLPYGTYSHAVCAEDAADAAATK